VAELQSIRDKLMKTLDIGERALQNRILAKESESLLPRRTAILALAADHGVSIGRYATPEELSQIRAAKGLEAGPPAAPVKSTASPARAAKSAKASTRKNARRPTAASRPAKKTAASGGRSSNKRNKVFVVHGRNVAVRKSMFAFLRCVELTPLEWSTAIAGTGKTNPSIHEILDHAFKVAGAVVVLLTPDDRVKLLPKFLQTGDLEYEKKLVGQARPNVLFEAGMAMGSYPERTVLVQVGNVKPFSDVAGRHITRLSNESESRHEFVTKLRNAGCVVDTDGSDWHSEGDFRA
jgi:predicted nucleotide-binding protein